MKKIIVAVANNQVQDVALGIAADVIQSVKVINESPLQCDLSFGDIEDSLEAWKWNTYPANGSAAVVHLETAVLPGGSSSGPTSSVVLLIWSKGEQVTGAGAGALNRVTSPNNAPNQQLEYFTTTGSSLTFGVIAGKVFYLVGFTYTSGHGSAVTDVEIQFINNGINVMSWWETINTTQGADFDFTFPQAYLTNDTISPEPHLLISGGPANQELIAWGYYQ